MCLCRAHVAYAQYCDDGHVAQLVELSEALLLLLLLLQVCTRYSSNDEVFLLCLLACVLMNQTGNTQPDGERAGGSSRWEVDAITGQFPQ